MKDKNQRKKLKILVNFVYHNFYIFSQIRRKYKYNKYIKYLLYFIYFPIALIRWFVRGICNFLYHKRIKMKYQSEVKYEFKYELAFVVIIKNEGSYIAEWINFHKMCGVDHFYMYDNDSTDDSFEILDPYIRKGLVTYQQRSGKMQQLPVYNEAFNKYKNECRYMGFIDADEFVFPADYRMHQKLLPQLVHEIMQKYAAGGIGINWRIYGSMGRKTFVNDPLIQRFTMRAHDECGLNHHIKTICNPRLIKEVVSPHFPIYKLGAYNVSEHGEHLYGWFNFDNQCEFIRINHYFCKSREEFVWKKNRGLADKNHYYNFSKFDQYDYNDVFDSSAAIFFNLATLINK